MSTTTELLAAKQAHQQLRNRIEALAAQWERTAGVLEPLGLDTDLVRRAAALRALLDDA